MSAPAALCATVEVAINRFLRLEASVAEACAELAGQYMEWSVRPGAISIFIEFMPGGVRVFAEPLQSPPNVRVEGSVGALLRTLGSLSARDRSVSEWSDLRIEGDAELLDRFRQMLTTVGFDPEEWLAPILGGVQAHRLVDGFKQLLGWTRTSTRRFADHGAEYLREESYDLARARDVERWANEVDDARDALDRMDARLKRLESAALIAQEDQIGGRS